MISRFFASLFKIVVVGSIFIGIRIGYELYHKALPGNQNTFLFWVAAGALLVMYILYRLMKSDKGRAILWEGVKTTLILGVLILVMSYLNSDEVSNSIDSAWSVMKGIGAIIGIGFFLYLGSKASKDPEYQQMSRDSQEDYQKQLDEQDRKRFDALQDRHLHSDYELSSFEEEQRKELENRFGRR